MKSFFELLDEVASTIGSDMQERRLYPRFPWAHSVRLRGARVEQFQAMSSDISVGGIGLELTRESVVALAQGGHILGPGDHLRVVLPADVAGGRGELDLRCRVRGVRRVSQEKYVAGTWFEQLDPGSEDVIDGLIEVAQKARWG